MTQPAPPAIRPEGSGFGVAALVLGICSVVFCWWGLVTLAMVVLAVTFGAKGLARPGRGMAIAGLSCGLVGAAAYLIVGVATLGVGFFL
jgi:hypothetical protein